MSITESALRQDPLFGRMPTAVRSGLLRIAAPFAAEAGQQFVFEREVPTQVFVATHGVARVFHTHPDGRQLTVKHLRAPVTMCEMQIIAGQTMNNAASALTPVCGYTIPAEKFLEALRRSPDASMFMMQRLASNFCIAANHEKSLFHQPKDRLASYLVSLSEVFGTPAMEKTELNLRLTQKDMAESIGATERGVRKIIAGWKEDGVIASTGGRYQISVPTLRAQAHGLEGNLNA